LTDLSKKEKGCPFFWNTVYITLNCFYTDTSI